MANRLFGQKGLAFKDEFLGNTKDYFRAELEALDFSKDPSGSRSKINSWVSEMTSEKIEELFDKNSISSGTVLALANAVYFNASWLHRFNAEKTKPQKFSASEDQAIQVPMMHLTQFDGLPYTSSRIKKFRLLELPYTDKNVSMIIAMDDEKDNFDSFLNRRLMVGLWGQIVRVTTKVAVEVSMPKFNLQQDIDLKEPLVALGLENLFESNADLSGIVDSVPLKLSKALHKANVAVGELGTEAAAATGFLGDGAIFFEDKTIEFTVDREFLFFVVEKPTGAILFFGHIKNPLKSN